MMTGYLDDLGTFKVISLQLLGCTNKYRSSHTPSFMGFRHNLPKTDLDIHISWTIHEEIAATSSGHVALPLVLIILILKKYHNNYQK